MLWIVITILFVLWLIGVFIKFTTDGLLHLLLIVTVIAAIVNLFKGKKTI